MKPDDYILGGDVENNDGTGDNYSIYNGGKEFNDDGSFLPFNRKYLLVAANPEAKEHNNSQKFFIAIKKNAKYDKKLQRFGEVLDGFKLVDNIANLGKEESYQNRPKPTIAWCGIIQTDFEDAFGLWRDVYFPRMKMPKFAN